MTRRSVGFGKMDREIRISREPAEYDTTGLKIVRTVKLLKGENPLCIRVRFADGHQACRFRFTSWVREAVINSRIEQALLKTRQKRE